ncbi:MAG TPA: polysulfide reductase NrfD [Armatimonadota bacterium]|nr:polysulfide reductase NrfD [Armatimonadota bacterium]HOP79578.1 polysulfide reductase NrfD [Armatimonadota bacterium]
MVDRVLRHIDEQVLASLGKPSRGYLLFLLACIIFILLGGIAYLFQYFLGMGVAGLNVPVSWGVYITNFVFWIGIAHSGTLISAILYLFRTSWRNAVNRSAEAMTVFAVLTAGMFPLIHLGRVWVFYWLLPYPNTMHLWPNFKSPLVWDVVAVTTYFTVSLLFFYVGMIPDLATARDRTSGWRRSMYTMLSLGWTGRYDQWRHYARVYLALAALATPLVISVHSVVSWDFAMSILPGWHTTIFAPYFVAGAIHSGLAMVITLLIPLRRILGLERIITMRHFESMALLMILTGLIVGYSYGSEAFIAWYSGEIFERQFLHWRAFGAYAPFFWLMVGFNVALPMTFFSKRLRTNIVWLAVVAVLVNVGMWFERFVIIVTSLSNGFLPSSWGLYVPTIVEFLITLMSFGFFLFLFLSFVKLFPAVAMSELKEQVVHKSEELHG